MHKTIRILTLLVAAMIVGAGEAWAEPTDGVNYCGKSDVNDGMNLVWYVTEEETDGVKTLHIDKNPAVTDANADFSMADYENNNGNFAPWIKPNDAGTKSDGLRYGITAVAIGAGVTSIGQKAFDVCKSLTSVTFAEGSQLKSIGKQAFAGCMALTTITLPSSLTTIGENAFGGCGLTDITIPASVTQIDGNAFASCHDLTTVTFNRDGYPIPTLGKGIFKQCENLKAIFVPSETAYNVYKAASDGSGWNQTENNRSLKSLLAPATISVAKNEGGWSTFCHNYGVAYSPSEGVTVHTVDGLSADGKSVNTKQVEGNLVSPGTPLLLNYSSTGDITLTANVDVEVTPSDKDIVDDGGTSVCFIGNASGSDLDCYNAALNDIIHEGHDASGTASYVLRNGEFVIVSSNSGLKAHRCLLNVSTTTSSARMLSIARGGEATVTSTPETYGKIFNRSSEQQKIDGGYLEFFNDEDCSNRLTLSNVIGLTDGKVYIKATPDNFHLLKGFLPVVEKCIDSGNGQARTRVLKTGAIEVTAVAGKTGVYQFTMPADRSDVAASAPFPEKAYKTKVKYLKWNGTDKKLEEATTDDNTKVYVLDGTETVLGVLDTGNDEIWYVAESSNLNYQDIELGGYVHLILADGAKMTCGGKIYDQGGAPDNFTIYGQSTNDGMGKLTVSNTNDTDYGINVSNITINGGSIEVTGSRDKGIYTGQSLTINGGRVKAYGKYGIYTTGSVRINGGQVEASGDYVGIWATNDFTISGGKVKTEGYNGIFAQNTVSITGGTVEAIGNEAGIWATNDLTISGGQVKATCSPPPNTAGICSNYGNIYLGYTNADDYIFATCYNFHSPHTISVDATAGQRFVAWNTPATEGDAETASSIVASGKVADLTTIDGKTLRPLAVSETVGGVTTTYPGYCLTVPAGTVVSGKTEADGTTPKPDFTIGGKPYFTYKTGDNVAFTLEDRGQDGVEVSGLPIDLAVTERIPTINFQMRTDDVNVTAKFYLQQTGVDYLDWDDTQGKLVAKNTKDLSPAPRVYMLDGTESVIGKTGEETWHVCTTAATENDGKGLVYTGEQIFSGTHVHLILADGAAMTSEGRLYGNVDNFTIHGQSDNEETMGRLTVTTTNNTDGISLNGFTVNGGIVEAASYYNRGIISNAVTINGGRVKAFGYSGINSYAVTIKGGQVEIHGTNYGFIGGGITLSWTSASDYIKARPYNGSVTISDGYYFTYEDNTGDPLTGAIDDFSTLAGKKLIPALKREANGETYIAYSSGNGNWKLNDADAQVYVITGYDLKTGEVLLEPVTGNEIPDGVPVIIGNKTDGVSLPASYWLLGEQKLSDGAAGIAASALANFFVSDGATTVGALLTEALGSTADLSDYVLFTLVNDGFKPVIATATSTPVKGTCLLAIPKVDLLNRAQGGSDNTSGARTQTIPIDLGGETGIEGVKEVREVNASLEVKDDSFYSLDGRRHSGMPAAKGMYIYKGTKVVVK